MLQSTLVKRLVAFALAATVAVWLYLVEPFSFAVVRPPPPHPQRQAAIALYDSAGYHDEVVGAYVYSLVRSGLKPDVYIRDKGFRYGMGEIVQEFFPWPVKQAGKDKAEIQSKIVANELDLVVFSTCVKGLPLLIDALTAPGVQTLVACTIHHGGEVDTYWDTLQPIARAGRLTLLGLSEHVVRAFSQRLDTKAETDNDPVWTAVGRQVFVPTFPADVVQKTRSAYARDKYFPANVAIQGNLQQGRRDYKGIFEQVLKHFAEDAAAWGYLFDEDLGKYVALPDNGANPPPFHLHLLGSLIKGFVMDPRLEDVALIRPGMTYGEYYELLASCDLLLPAFASKDYLKATASSSIGAALISRLPILGQQSLSDAYTYLAAPAQVLAPTDEPVMDTIRALRIKSLASDLPHVGAAAELREWDALLERLYDENERGWDSILDRPLPDPTTLARPSLSQEDAGLDLSVRSNRRPIEGGQGDKASSPASRIT